MIPGDQIAAEKFGNELLRKVGGDRERAVRFAAYLTHYLANQPDMMSEETASEKQVQDDYGGGGDHCECGGSTFTITEDGETCVVHTIRACTNFRHRFRDAHGTRARDQAGWQNYGTPGDKPVTGDDTSIRASLLEL